MPQLSDRFSAYPVTVRLDANGDGTIRFQAQGKNIVITNLYVSVATQTAQAKCTIYKQNVGAQWALDTTNSGSTGASARGRIELLDGEAVYVVWDGGDANTIATATFTGYSLPFSVTPEAGTDFVWADPIAAGDGSLIYPAIKSPDYVAGVSGWSINRDGSAEFSEGTFRGDVEIFDPLTGEGIIIQPNPAGLQIVPPTAAAAISNGFITAGYGGTGTSAFGIISVTTPVVGVGLPADIRIKQQGTDGSTHGAHMQMLDTSIIMTGEYTGGAEAIVSAPTFEATGLPQSDEASSADNQAAISNTSPYNGTNVCGVSFVAPPSGKVRIHANGAIGLTGGTGQTFLGPQIRDGSTIGSGSVVYDPSSDPGCKLGTSAVGVTINGGASTLVTGLTAGGEYNVCCTVWVQAGAAPVMQYFSRQVGVDMVW